MMTPITPSSTGLAGLEARLREDLAWLELPAKRWLPERTFDSRKHLLEYDEVMDHQRKEVYGYRQRILEGGNSVRHASRQAARTAATAEGGREP